jgi:hypothetical protein
MSGCENNINPKRTSEFTTLPLHFTNIKHNHHNSGLLSEPQADAIFSVHIVGMKHSLIRHPDDMIHISAFGGEDSGVLG